MSVHMYHSKSEKLVCSLQHLKCLRKIVLVQMEDPIRVQLFNGTLLNELYQIISDPPPTHPHTRQHHFNIVLIFDSSISHDPVHLTFWVQVLLVAGYFSRCLADG